MATIKIKSNGNKYCSECRIGIQRLAPYCPFCGAFLSNYEEILIKDMKDKEDTNIYNND